jgi:hypothetical protein
MANNNAPPSFDVDEFLESYDYTSQDKVQRLLDFAVGRVRTIRYELPTDNDRIRMIQAAVAHNADMNRAPYIRFLVDRRYEGVRNCIGSNVLQALLDAGADARLDWDMGRQSISEFIELLIGNYLRDGDLRYGYSRIECTNIILSYIIVLLNSTNNIISIDHALRRIVPPTNNNSVEHKRILNLLEGLLHFGYIFQPSSFPLITELLRLRPRTLTATDRHGSSILHNVIYNYNKNRHIFGTDAHNNAYKYIKFLIEHGADPTARNNVGQTPRAIAVSLGKTNLIDMFPETNRGNIYGRKENWAKNLAKPSEGGRRH